MNTDGMPVREHKKRMHYVWKAKDLFEITMQRLCYQIRALRNNGWLTEFGLEAIKRRISSATGHARNENSVVE